MVHYAYTREEAIVVHVRDNAKLGVGNYHPNLVHDVNGVNLNIFEFAPHTSG